VTRFRVLPVVLALGGYALLAVIGQVLGYLYVRHLGNRRNMVIDMFVGRQVNPFSGGFMGDLRARGLMAWAIGLVVALVVVAGFVLLTARGGPRAVLTGGWLGSILGSAAGSLVSAIVFLPYLFRSSTAGFDQQRYIQYLSSVQHGLYYGAVAGLFVGLAAMLGALGGSPRHTDADAPPVPHR